MKKLYIVIISIVLFISFGYSQTDTTFWFAVPEVTWAHNGGNGEPTYIRISALDIAANVTLSMPATVAFTPISINIPAGTTKTIDLTGFIRTGYPPAPGTANDANIIESGLPGREGIMDTRGFLLESDNLITAYLERSNTHNCDIWALKGKNAMGTTFVIPSQNMFNNQPHTPSAINAFDIVATEDNTTVTIYPKQNLVGPGGWVAGGTYTINLMKGQSVSCVATGTAAASHLGGSRVTSTKPITIMWKDDSVRSDLSGCYDLMGDQMIPTRLAGKEYIVMRGQLGQNAAGGNQYPNSEFSFVMATVANTTVTYTSANGVSNVVLVAVGDINRQLMNGTQIASATPTIDYLHIKADKPVIVFHVTGFGCEMGTAILPTIDGCTGSLEVSFVRSTTEGFFLNIMTTTARLNGFKIDISGTAYSIPATFFEPVGATGWHVLKKTHNNFGVAHTVVTHGAAIPAAITGSVTRVHNAVGVFHLGLINGGVSSGCRYGYFSDYSTNRGAAIATETDSDLATACYGDSIQLKVTGGTTYDWNPKLNITNPNISNPIVFPPSGAHYYEVKMSRPCFIDTTMKVGVVVDSEVRSYYELQYSSATNCSPLTVEFDNLSIGGVTYVWDFGDGSPLSFLEDPPPKTYLNTTAGTLTYTIGLTVQGNNCNEYFQRTIHVYPGVTANISPALPSIAECAPLTQVFGSTLTGNIDVLYWDFGDGDISYANPTPTHTFNNLTNNDITYQTILVATDTTFGYCEDRDTMLVTVYDRVEADFTASKNQGCSPLAIDIVNSSKGTLTYAWTFGANSVLAGNPLTDTTFIVTYTNTAATNMLRDIKLVASNNNNCKDSLTFSNITIYPQFTTVINTPNPLAGCNPLPIDFSQTTTPLLIPNLQYEWDFGNGSTSGANGNPVPISKTFDHTLPVDQPYQVTLTTTSEYNCKATATPINVTSWAFVDASFTINDTSGCSPFTVSIKNNSHINSVQNFVWNLDGGVGFESNTLPFSVVYTNTGTLPIVKTITLSNNNPPHNCPVSYTKKITVNPAINARFTKSNTTVCNNVAISFTNTSYYTVPANLVGGAGTYLWEFGDGTTANSQNPTKAYNNTTNVLTPYTVKLTLTVNGCISTYSEVVSVYPQILAQLNTANLNVCTGPASTTITLNNTSIGATNYLWEFTDGTADVPMVNKNPINYAVDNTDPDAVIHSKVYLTAFNPNCSHKDSITLTVFPHIVPLIVPDPISGCGPLAVELSNLTTGGDALYPLTYDWTIDGAQYSTSSAAIIFDTLANKTPVDAPYTFSLKATNNIGCFASSTALVTVFPEIEPKFGFTKSTECSPMQVFMDNGSLNGNQFNWDFGFDGKDTTTTKPNPQDFSYRFYHTYTNPNLPDTYNIKLVVVDTNHPQCKDSVTHPITINPPVVSSFVVSNNQITCSPSAAVFTNNSTGYNLTYVWDYNDANTSATGANIHTHMYDNLAATTKVYTVKLTTYDDKGCPNATTQTVTRYPKVIANFTFLKDLNSKCTPYPIEFKYPETALNGNSFAWDFGDGTLQETKTNKNKFFHTFDNTTANTVNAYTVRLTSTDTNTGCNHDTTAIIRVFPRLIPKFEPDTNKGCNPLPIAFTNQTNGAGGLSSSWAFGDNQTSPDFSPNHTFVNLETQNRNYNVILTTLQDSTGCSKTVDTTITVYSYVKAIFGLVAESQSGLKAASIGSKASATIVGGCTPFNVVITDSSKVNGKKKWNFDDIFIIPDSSASLHKLTYLNTDNSPPLINANYTIKMLATNNEGCADSIEQDLVAYPRPIADFNADFIGCHPHNINIDNQSAANDDYNYYWELGDGSTLVTKDINHTFYNYSNTNDDSVSVKLITASKNECSDTVTKFVRVYPAPLAAITTDKDRGCPPFQTALSNDSKGTDLTYYWDFDNGDMNTTNSTATNSPLYINNTDTKITYNVQLIVETSTTPKCYDTVLQPIVVYPNVVAAFTPDLHEGCSPIVVNFANNSTPVSADGATVFNWSFGDGVTSINENPIYRFVNETVDDITYTVTLDVASVHGCVSKATDLVTVYLQPNAEFFVDQPRLFYPTDTTMKFENMVKPGPWIFDWNFGDGSLHSSDTNKFHEHNYTGWGPPENDFSYTVTLIVKSEHCDDTTSQIVTISPPPPYIEITGNNPFGCEPLTVNFSVKYFYGYTDAIRWDFGDEEKSQDINPIHIYENDGLYISTVSIKGDGGIFIDTTKVFVHPLPKPSFEFTPDFIMLGNDQAVQFYNTTYLIDSSTYLWNFGDETTTSEIVPIHLYSTPGMFNVKLVATTNHGCKDSVTLQNAVEVSGEGYLKFPNAFLPISGASGGAYESPDIKNDVFHPKHEGVKDYELWIFNRWGEQVFYSDNILVGWNGRYGNTAAELGQDVYFWKAKGVFNNDVPFKMAGDVTLIRR